MKTRTCFVAALLLAVTAAHAQTPVDAPAPVVQVGLIMIQPNGSVGGSANRIARQAGEEMSGSLWLGTCSYGAGPVPASATDVWQLSGKVLTIGAGEASVQIGWQRSRRGGQDESSPPQSPRTLRLKSGERVTLERNALPPGSCGEGHVVLEVTFASREDRGHEREPLQRSVEDLKSASEAMATRLRGNLGTADLWLVR